MDYSEASGYCVGVIGEDYVNARIGQKLCLTAENPLVRGAVEAIYGFIPKVGVVIDPIP